MSEQDLKQEGIEKILEYEGYTEEDAVLIGRILALRDYPHVVSIEPYEDSGAIYRPPYLKKFKLFVFTTEREEYINCMLKERGFPPAEVNHIPFSTVPRYSCRFKNRDGSYSNISMEIQS